MAAELLQSNEILQSNDEIKELKILWHMSYYDIPLNGIALYNGEKVFFNVTRSCMDYYFIKPDIQINPNDEDYDFLHDLPVWPNSSIKFDESGLHYISGEVYDFVNENIQQTDIKKRVDFHDIEIDDKMVSIYQCTLIDLYRMPLDKLKEYDDSHREFQENVGYHTDHDPAIYKPYDTNNREKTNLYFNKRNEEYEEMKKNGIVNSNNISSYTYIRTVTGSQFTKW